MVTYLEYLDNSESSLYEPSDEEHVRDTIMTVIVKYSLFDNDINRTKIFLKEILPTIKEWVYIEGTDQELINTLIEKAQQVDLDELEMDELNDDGQLTIALPLFVRAYFRSSQSDAMYQLLYIFMFLAIDDEDLVYSYVLLMDAIVHGESSEYIQQLIYEIDEECLDLFWVSMKTMFLPTDLVRELYININDEYKLFHRCDSNFVIEQISGDSSSTDTVISNVLFNLDEHSVKVYGAFGLYFKNCIFTSGKNETFLDGINLSSITNLEFLSCQFINIHNYFIYLTTNDDLRFYNCLFDQITIQDKESVIRPFLLLIGNEYTEFIGNTFRNIQVYDNNNSYLAPFGNDFMLRLLLETDVVFNYNHLIDNTLHNSAGDISIMSIINNIEVDFTAYKNVANNSDQKLFTYTDYDEDDYESYIYSDFEFADEQVELENLL